MSGASGRPAPRSWDPPRQPPPVPQPRSWGDQDDPDAAGAPAGGEGSALPVRPRPAPVPPAQRGGPAPAYGGRPEFGRAEEPSNRPQPAPPQPVEPRGEEDFATGADTGWRAAEAIRSQGAPDVTAAGLPRRTPLARLVPGSASSSDPTARPTRRDAEAVRGRLASYQRGVRSGRENRDRTGDADQAGGPPPE